LAILSLRQMNNRSKGKQMRKNLTNLEGCYLEGLHFRKVVNLLTIFLFLNLYKIHQKAFNLLGLQMLWHSYKMLLFQM
jgi:hypothetical protein